MHEIAERDGYYGGIRLIYATCKKFFEYFNKSFRKNFTVSYDTNIPRQVGLGGSSAIIWALTKALLQFYQVKTKKELLPNFLLGVEKDELGISAGLQDRVIQVYGGTVFMDFNKNLMQSRGYGNYEYIDSKLLPKLFIAYLKNPSTESGRMHNPIRFRFEQGDKEVISAMQEFASFAEQGRKALLERDYELFGELMNKNFDLRRKLYGDQAIGKENLEMIKIARENNCPAKFCGSGGAIVGMLQNNEQFARVRKVYQNKNYKCEEVRI